MKKNKPLIFLLAMAFFLSAFTRQADKTHTLTVEVNNLRNSDGVIQFALYNTLDVFPDEHYEKFFQKTVVKITNNKARITFKNLSPGKYAVNILHDEDENGKIKKGLALPKEGIGFSNYNSIGMFNRPKFEEASFELKKDTSIQVKIIYL